mmetsp:Transcript_49229/g.56569  ORF Transcript_49229/g.56569 Transcript_49229/m.56569 type:complete len:99 (-) Transcript_49229:80-376(-)
MVLHCLLFLSVSIYAFLSRYLSVFCSSLLIDIFLLLRELNKRLNNRTKSKQSNVVSYFGGYTDSRSDAEEANILYSIVQCRNNEKIEAVGDQRGARGY